MSSNPKHNRIIQLLALVLLANFALANLAFAQVSDDGTCTGATSPVAPVGTGPDRWQKGCIAAGGTWTPSAKTPAVKVTKTDFDAANNPASKANCDILSRLVSIVTGGDLKAALGQGLTGPINAQRPTTICEVVDGTVQVDTNGFWNKDGKLARSTLALNFQTKLVLGTTFTQDQWATKQKANVGKIVGASAGGDFIGWILNMVLSVVASALSILTALAAEVFSYASGAALDISTMPAAVNIGWAIVRDICNMFFIIILIVIALAAILHIESYDYRHLLGHLVIMAILVNFSQVIAVEIMKAVNLLALIFRGNGLDGVMGAIFSVLDFKELFSGNVSWQEGLALGLGKIAYAIVGLVVYLALAAMFIIRLVGLYVLIIFSPVAYVARILPATEKYSEEWWSHFVKYLIWAPVAMFMIRLTILVANDPRFAITGAENTSFKFWILCAFLAASLLVAKEAGMVGGEMIVHGVQGTATAALKGIGHGMGRFAGRKYNEATGKLLHTEGGKKPSKLARFAYAALNPVGTYKGFSKRGEELAHHQTELATAYGQQIAERLWTGTTLPHAQLVERRAENEKLKFLTDMKKEQLMQLAVEAEGIGGHEGETTRLAIMKAVAANGFTDDLMRMKHFTEKYGEKITHPDGTQSVAINSPDTVHRLLMTYLGKGEQAMRFIGEDMEDMGKNTNHPEYLGHTFFNPDTSMWEEGMKEVGPERDNGFGHKIKTLDNTHQADYAKGEFSKKKVNDLVTMAPHGLAPIMGELDADGKIITSKTPIMDPTTVKPIMDEATGQQKRNANTGELMFTEPEQKRDANGKLMFDVRTDGKEIRNTYWGATDITDASKAFYDQQNNLMNDPVTLDRVQNIQPRVKDTQLATKVTHDGRLIINNSDELRKVQNLWTHQRDQAQVLYAEKLGLPQNQRGGLSTMKLYLNYESDPAKREVFVDGDRAVDFNYSFVMKKAAQAKGAQNVDGGGGGQQQRAQVPQPPAPPAAPFLTDARGNPIDREGNPIRP
ncbi:MAG: hypothetical protein A3J07_02090 [Candidatus Doudnabacteria bacterium RIFCSPLOWO2_02_FULL_49_13]|uniref:Uncharacterized protein n=1 Tax=Candidatus Doudnabacteria bacterium RIFCSPHIGHO2_12_FULL_48_16 TaxID=1817838 RepID=A0A1F5PLP1_9BACT|nr:MAG: hypothetical protein A3B77_00620 [Candidatus Doudnabacteria bacterium RIFCSPHIGHO2_02_FULL_49_24]OGE88755.1 MAG: hypothetical protein A2760_00975 [Candidatus Doudnabacteria bacterium RIFCSPHIGHO2_01_FULL_50_67]OGE90724.1 MAG: hypothetical protein A3E29_01190 [Candidatus Doudnabacteria bacterium RIFCSPHIGHO2_12_FULL_48_16]OGF02587.1 MAG: hypothetical protein A3J07_02090 [Candidatus Doudnabacteria bacterium RIFCSPLOWO2_02_FULL_49_13]OGF02657.1 MAG: hypothetical protein A3H14_00925 [Candid